jgi:amino acid transporter
MTDKVHEHDKQVLHKMGYAQELARRMSGFSNFAISFSIICILAGGISSFYAAFNSTGGGGAFIGWLVGGFFSLMVAFSMGQIASAYPTAGGLYHWASILGGKFLVQPAGVALCCLIGGRLPLPGFLQRNSG